MCYTIGMPMFRSEVWLDDNLFAAPVGQPPKWRLALDTWIEGRDEQDVAETLFALCNSYPDEMHVNSSFLDLVIRYREEKNRSLSVGDKVVVNGRELYCDSFGFSEQPVGIFGSRASTIDPKAEDGPSIVKSK